MPEDRGGKYQEIPLPDFFPRGRPSTHWPAAVSAGPLSWQREMHRNAFSAFWRPGDRPAWVTRMSSMGIPWENISLMVMSTAWTQGTNVLAGGSEEEPDCRLCFCHIEPPFH